MCFSMIWLQQNPVRHIHHILVFLEPAFVTLCCVDRFDAIFVQTVGFFINAAEAILLGFQHYLVMLGTTVLIPSSLVPQMGGGNVRLMSNSQQHIIILILVLLFEHLPNN